MLVERRSFCLKVKENVRMIEQASVIWARQPVIDHVTLPARQRSPFCLWIDDAGLLALFISTFQASAPRPFPVPKESEYLKPPDWQGQGTIACNRKPLVCSGSIFAPLVSL